VIAQAAPSLFHWIIPKASIVVDSSSMEMRKITDLRAINRLLVNANTLDGVNAVEISQLVKQGELIALSKLTSKHENEGFHLPKALAYIHPGAENLIYNAPRYYQLGQNLLNRSLSLHENPADSNEISLFQQDIAALSHFEHMILYSSEGMQIAIRAQKALKLLIPDEKFIIAYLQFNSEGKVLKSHLLIDNNSEIASAAVREHEEFPKLELVSEKVESPPTEPPDKDHPVYLQLTALKYMRQQTLTPIADQMIALLNNHNREVQPAFLEQFQALIAQYNQVSQEQEQVIIQKFSEIYQDQTDIPFKQLVTFVKEAGLETLLKDTYSKLNLKKEALDPGEFELQLKKIEESQNWQDLAQQINETAEVFKSEEALLANQNPARVRVYQKLNEFLLLPSPHIPHEEFNKESRDILVRILKTSWIYDPDAHDFYLSEFDLRVQKPTSQNEPL
jgi:hypothetical protein